MADLSFSQGSDPVCIFNDLSGNQLVVNSDGSINGNLSKVGGTVIALGQTTMAASLPVAVASDQSTITISTEGKKTTYAGSFTGLVPAAAATDVFTIIGSATKTVRIISISLSISTTAGSGIAVNVSLIKRSTADTAGTSTNATNVPYDSNNAAATAVMAGYTVNPTLGTAIGSIRVNRFAITTAGTSSNPILWEFGIRPAQAIVLRGVAQQLCINLNGAVITGPIADCSIEWTEE